MILDTDAGVAVTRPSSRSIFSSPYRTCEKAKPSHKTGDRLSPVAKVDAGGRGEGIASP